MNDELSRMQLQLDKHAVQIAKLFSKIDDTNAKIQKIFNMLNQIKTFCKTLAVTNTTLRNCMSKFCWNPHR